MQARNNYFPVQTLKDSALLRTLFTIDVSLVQLKFNPMMSLLKVLCLLSGTTGAPQISKGISSLTCPDHRFDILTPVLLIYAALRNHAQECFQESDNGPERSEPKLPGLDGLPRPGFSAFDG
jgi:hypothetical protein